MGIVTANYFPESSGIAPYATEASHFLHGAGHAVTVYTGVPHYPEWRVEEPYRRGLRWNEQQHGVRLRRVRHWVPAHANVLGRSLMESSFLMQTAPAVRRGHDDVLLAFTPALSALAAAQFGRRGRPLGVIVQDLTGNAAAQSSATSAGVGSRLARAEYNLLGEATLVGVITERFGDILASHGVKRERIRYVPNFTHIRASGLDIAEAKLRFGFPPDKAVVLHTGNMGLKQGLEAVISAARLAASQWPEGHFVLVGDGSQRDRLLQSAAGLSNLEIRPFVAEEDYPDLLAAADVLLVNEKHGVLEMSLPSKLTSYSVAGRPIVAAVEPAGTTAEVLGKYQAAVMTGPGDPEHLLEALRSVCQSEELRSRVVAGGRQLHETEYGRSAARDRYVDFVGELAVGS